MDDQLDKAIIQTAIGGIRSLLVLVLSVGFLGMGMLKVVSMPQLIAYWTYWGMPKWSLYAVGIYELMLAITLFFLPTRTKALWGTFFLMLGALCIHLIFGEYNYLAGPIAIIIACGLLYFVEWKITQK